LKHSGWVSLGMGAQPSGLPPGALIKAFDIQGRCAYSGRADAAGFLTAPLPVNGLYRLQVQTDMPDARGDDTHQRSAE
jgi:hypothetical protein